MPAINWILLLAVLLLVGALRSSSALASAYGIAVTGTMVVTVTLATIVARHVWGWSRLRCALVMGPLFVVDFVFLSANALKILAGGWLPVLAGSALLLLMLTWRRGSAMLLARTR